MKLKGEGYGSLRISNLLKIPKPTIEWWIHKGGKPYYFSEKRIKACNSVENIKRLKKLSRFSQPIAVKEAQKSNIKPLLNDELDENLSYVLGVLYGDGHLSQRRVILSAVDKDFVQNFKKCLDNWSLYESKLYKKFIKLDSQIKNRKPQWSCYLDSIAIHDFLKDFNTYQIEKDIHKIKFIQGFFDSEGSFSKSYELLAYNKNYDVLKLVSIFLKDLKIDNYIKTYTVKNLNGKTIKYHYLRVFGKSRYDFYHKIGFNIRRKQKRLTEWAQRIGSRKYKED